MNSTNQDVMPAVTGKHFKSAAFSLSVSYHYLVEQYPSIQRFSEGAGVLITDILHCAFGNQ
ncbi:TPA_asm: hypothetical protein GND82_004157 [Salmonella enterica subsp. salamae serovar 60:g,m,t:z6]|uniref:Uncharacterized protein n=1 Tax=Salmonella enterica subsp. houtenae serovar 1,40:z4,z32:- TaxID=1967604 RepID=A0A730ZTN6_SALHO|nr:hypothetical protein [Salmonella enterica subsp. salamae]EAO6409402.1 hypothetical protein [Salmonella enterica]EBW4677739.1 hypothetical protein [Salmonella enterica subsp. salamae serovar Sofia]EDU6438657.1 hypothetical protein [Salmonella enterica subsp. salamae serovar 47:b:e,n,x,z15]HAC6700745.1 hypothetical protein [Salmonella bongori serovar 66:z65:-]HAE2269528.1 hypothetical protein [Salmonella enterica subsp. enterica serovar 1,9,12:-:-]HAE4190991.1 hypothetical protein [Salmonell